MQLNEVLIKIIRVVTNENVKIQNIHQSHVDGYTSSLIKIFLTRYRNYYDHNKCLSSNKKYLT